MALANDLMGLGESGKLASRLANGGTGPVSITASGTTAATATQIYGTQFVVYVNATAGVQGVQFTAPGGDNGALIYDDFVVHNGYTSSIYIYAPTGVTINVGGAGYTSALPFTLATLKTLTVYTGPTQTQWFGLSA